MTLVKGIGMFANRRLYGRLRLSRHEGNAGALLRSQSVYWGDRAM